MFPTLSEYMFRGHPWGRWGWQPDGTEHKNRLQSDLECFQLHPTVFLSKWRWLRINPVSRKHLYYFTICSSFFQPLCEVYCGILKKKYVVKYVCHVFFFRELHEESGLTVDTLEKIGNIKFEFVGETELHDVHIFRADSYNGQPTESVGMRKMNFTALQWSVKKWKMGIVKRIIEKRLMRC